ncbi:MAG: hypothetical protein JXR51_10120 [Bacteroidales bacterium]|nr:hypothetical protein [Bacteroidales bacterium]
MIINYLISNPRIEKESLNKQILNEIKKAKYSIWFANIWFSNKKLYQILMDKLDEGLNVEILVNPNFISLNENYLIQDFIDNGGELYTLPYNNDTFFTNKYCIIDYSKVISEDFKSEYSIKPNQGSAFIRESDSTMLEHYINDYMLLKNNYSINRY